MTNSYLIPLIRTVYTAHRTHTGYAVKCAGRVVCEFTHDYAEHCNATAFDLAASRCYQLNRAGIL